MPIIPKILLIGAGGYFADSLLFFKEKGYEVTCIALPGAPGHFARNYNLYNNLGFMVLEWQDSDEFIESLQLNEDSLILRGNFFGNTDALKLIHEHAKQQLEVFHRVTKFVEDNGTGTKSALYFCGDNAFIDESDIEFFSKMTRYTSACLFDNDLIRDFVWQNVPALKAKTHFVTQFETPLKRFVQHNSQKPDLDSAVLSVGRDISTSDLDRFFEIKRLPEKTNLFIKVAQKVLKKFFSIRIKKRYNLAVADSIQELSEDRKRFQRDFAGHRFGLSYFYDLLEGAYDFTKNKQLYFSPEHQQRSFKVFNKTFENKESHPVYYQFINTPSKDITYLMLGLIPIISHTEHSFYKSLVDKKMAILVQSKEDFKKLHRMSVDEITAYRKNIFDNSDVFTFEPTGELLLNWLQSGNRPEFSQTDSLTGSRQANCRYEQFD